MRITADWSRFPEPWCRLGPGMAAEVKVAAGRSSLRPRFPEKQFSGHKLRQYRQTAFMSQPELGKVAGYRADQIGNWERGEVVPNQRAIVDLAEALSVDPRQLYTE